MEDNLDTFPTRKRGEIWSVYVRRILHWHMRLKRELEEMRLKKPIMENNAWIEIEDSNGKQFYVNIKQLFGEE